MNGSVADMPWTSPLYMCYENGLTQWWVVLWYLTSDSLRCYVMISWMHGFCRGAAVPLYTCDSMSLLPLASQFSPAWFLMATPQTTCLDQSIIDHYRLCGRRVFLKYQFHACFSMNRDYTIGSQLAIFTIGNHTCMVMHPLSN